MLAASLCAFGCAFYFSLTAFGASERSWAEIQRKGSEALDANRYWLAEPLLKDSVTEAEKLGFGSPMLAKSLSELGRYYTIRGKFSLAEPYLERELAVREAMYDKDGGQTIQSMGSLIRFYLAYGTKSKAEPLTNDVLAFVEGKAREPREMAQAKTKKEEGAPLVGWLGSAAPTEVNPLIEWAITCDTIGNDYRFLGKYETAEKLYKTALDLKSRVLGVGHLSLAGSYDNLGILCMTREEYKEAEGYFRDALETTEKTLSPDSPEVYSRLDRLAKCLIKEKKFAEAEELYKRALTFWSKEPSKSGDESRALFSLGALYVEEHKYGSAAPVLRHALQRAQKFSGPLSIQLVPYMEKYAYALYYLGARGECANLRARAKTIAGDCIAKPVIQVATASETGGGAGASTAEKTNVSNEGSEKRTARRRSKATRSGITHRRRKRHR